MALSRTAPLQGRSILQPPAAHAKPPRMGTFMNTWSWCTNAFGLLPDLLVQDHWCSAF